jgi:hypothetical protein
MWYDVAYGDAFHDTVIWLDDMAVAVTPVGVAGGGGLFTVCISAGLVLGLKEESPAYDAVILCDPTDNEDVESVATLPDVVPVPSVVVPSRNVTVSPLGTAGLIVAVNVTESLDLDGLRLDDRVVVVTTALTACEIAGLVLVAKLASPAYDAVILCDPTDNEDVESVATLPDVVPVPILTPLS